MGKFFQLAVDPTLCQSLAGGPSGAPSAGGDSLHDTPTHTLPARTVGKSGGVLSTRDGLNVDNSVVHLTHFYIIKILAKINHKTTIFIACTGQSKSEPNSFNSLIFLNLVFILIYKHGFK